MANQIGVFSLWLMFAVWGYTLLIYVLGFFWFQRHKSVIQLFSKKLIALTLTILILNTVGQVFMVILFVRIGEDILNIDDKNLSLDSTKKNLYLILFVVNLFLMLIQLVIFLFFSNNFAVKFTTEKLHIVGMSVLYSAIIGLRKKTDGTVILEYVYKKENRQIWTEKLKFISFFDTTAFLFDHGRQFFNPERNLAFFDLDKVTKKYSSDPIKKPTNTAKSKSIIKKKASSKPVKKAPNLVKSKPTIKKRSLPSSLK